MIRSITEGRTGNLLLRNIGISILSKKFNLQVENYIKLNNQELLGLKLYSGENKNDQIIRYTDEDLMNLLDLESIQNGIFYDGFFQVRDFIIKYKNEILNHFNLIYDTDQKNDVFVHVRLGDVTHITPGLSYYRNALSEVNFNEGYVSSDSPDNDIVKSIINEFGLKLYKPQDAIETINFAKNFNNLVLSKGTFSWWMGMLSKNGTNIFYPSNDVYPNWHGDIFLDEWCPII